MAIQWSQHGDDVPQTGTAVPYAALCCSNRTFMELKWGITDELGIKTHGF